MQQPKQKTVIGQAERIALPEWGYADVHARIDTGARTSAIWASRADVEDGRLAVVFFGEKSPHYTGETVYFDKFEQTAVASSTGHISVRYKVQTAIRLGGRRIRTYFTLADRSTQVYPVLIGRNTLRGKFIVDVKQGVVLRDEEKQRNEELQAYLRSKDTKES